MHRGGGEMTRAITTSREGGEESPRAEDRVLREGEGKRRCESGGQATKKAMKAIMIAAGLVVSSAAPAISVGRTPQQFVGEWCVDKAEAEVSFYKRSRNCKYDEDKLVLRPDKALIAGEVE